MKSLRLFNAVIRQESSDECFVSEDGFVIEPGALWAKDRIVEHYRQERLSGNDLNKTFHKSWAKIKQSSRFELWVEQIRHYLSTYGSDFQDEIYIPDEVLHVPDAKLLMYKVVRALSTDEMTGRCFDLLNSGIALKGGNDQRRVDAAGRGVRLHLHGAGTDTEPGSRREDR